MKDYIIDHPHLQSLQKRLSSLIVWAVCWLLWIYLLVPVVTLVGWLLGDPALNDEIYWFGGYSSLLQLLKMCLVILLGQTLFWFCWIFLRAHRKRRVLAASAHPVDDNQLCTFYEVDATELTYCRNARQITVYFDRLGAITHLAPDISPPNLSSPTA